MHIRDEDGDFLFEPMEPIFERVERFIPVLVLAIRQIIVRAGIMRVGIAWPLLILRVAECGWRAGFALFFGQLLRDKTLYVFLCFPDAPR